MPSYLTPTRTARLLAHVLDGLPFIVLGMIVVFIAQVLLYGHHPDEVVALSVILFWATMGLRPIVVSLSESIDGRSFGKRVFDLIVIDGDGEPVTGLGAWGRGLTRCLCAALPLVEMLPLFTHRQRALHDWICGTRVVRYSCWQAWVDDRSTDPPATGFTLAPAPQPMAGAQPIAGYIRPPDPAELDQEHLPTVLVR